MGNFPGGEGGMFDVFMVDNKGDDNPERQDGSMRLRNVRTMHHDNVPTEDLLFSGAMYTPSQFGQQSMPGRLDPGTMVYGIKIPGQNQVIVLGQAQTQKKSGSGSGGGGTDLLSNYSETFSNKLPINVPPDIQESTDADGVKIRKIKEKGEQHSLSLLDGLPSHGALFNMAGFRLPELPNVPTAKQTNDGMMNNQMMEQMTGQIMSMAQMFQGLMGNRGGGGGGGGMGAGPLPGSSATNNGNLGSDSYSAYNIKSNSQMSQILKKLTPNMQTAVRNLSLLVQGLETTNGVAFFTGNVVHEDTYLKNAEELLSQVTSLDDLMYVMQRLQWDDSLFGHDKLEKVITEIETAWGTALQEVDYNGNIVVTYKVPNSDSIKLKTQKIFLSNTGTVANVTANNIGTNIWDADLYNLKTTVGLYKDTEITNAVDITGSFGSNGGRYVVTKVVDNSTVKFRAKGGTVPVAGNVGDIYIITTSVDQGGGAEAQFYQSMGSSEASPSISSLPSAGGGSGGSGGSKSGFGQLQGMMGNLFGRSSGTMQEMWKRLSQSGEKEAKQMHQKLNQDKMPQTAAQAAKDTKDGQDPLKHFKKMGG